MRKQLHSRYYEAILQLRPESVEVINFVDEFLSRRGDCKITQIKTLKTGIDLYLTSQRAARALGGKLKRRFKNGELTLSRSLHHRDRFTSKEAYRVTVLFRMKQQDI